jgi:hypothetical protein
MMATGSDLSRYTIQIENRIKPTYRSTIETMPQGMESNLDPSPVKSPIVKA